MIRSVECTGILGLRKMPEAANYQPYNIAKKRSSDYEKKKST